MNRVEPTAPNRCRIAAEAGVNDNGDLELAKRPTGNSCRGGQVSDGHYGPGPHRSPMLIKMGEARIDGLTPKKVTASTPV